MSYSSYFFLFDILVYVKPKFGLDINNIFYKDQSLQVSCTCTRHEGIWGNIGTEPQSPKLGIR